MDLEFTSVTWILVLIPLPTHSVNLNKCQSLSASFLLNENNTNLIILMRFNSMLKQFIMVKSCIIYYLYVCIRW